MFRKALLMTTLGALALVAAPLTTSVSAHAGHRHVVVKKRVVKKVRHAKHRTTHHHVMTPGMKM